MLTDKRFVPYCRTCQKPLKGSLSTFENVDHTWSLDLSDMACEGSEELYATYKEEFSLETITEEQDGAFDDFVAEHLDSWTVMEMTHVEGTTDPRI